MDDLEALEIINLRLKISELEKDNTAFMESFNFSEECRIELIKENKELKKELKERIDYDLKEYNDLAEGYKKQRKKIIELEKQLEIQLYLNNRR